MREHKFRIWWKGVKEMRHFSKGYIQCGHKDFQTGIIFPIEENGQGVFLGHGEVMQFTGLKDANGKDIYECDILSGHFSNGEELLQEVRYNEQSACFGAVNLPENKYSSRINGINQLWIDEFQKKVIGNVFQNPELIEDGAKSAANSSHNSGSTKAEEK